jgi:hypothetical protein
MLEGVDETERERVPTLLAGEQDHHHQNDAEAARGALPRGKLNLHLLEVELEDVEDIEEVEEHPGPSTVSGAPESIARVEHDSITETLDPIQSQIETSRMQSRETLG